MPPPNNRLCFPKRIALLVIASLSLVIFIVSCILFWQSLEGAIGLDWLHASIVGLCISLPVAILFYSLACCEAAVRVRRGQDQNAREPDSNCNRLCGCVSCSCQKCNRTPARTTEEPAPSRSEEPMASTSKPADLGTSSRKEIVKMQPQAHSSTQPDSAADDDYSIVSSRWNCILCAFCRNLNDQEPTPTTTEDLVASTTDATDSISSIKEEIEMSNVPKVQPKKSSPITKQVGASVDSRGFRCFIRCFDCRCKDAQEPKSAIDELTSSGPSDFSIGSHNEGIQMANLTQPQTAGEEMPEESATMDAEVGKSTSADVEKADVAENTQQKGESSKPKMESPNEESSDISVETAF